MFKYLTMFIMLCQGGGTRLTRRTRGFGLSGARKGLGVQIPSLALTNNVEGHSNKFKNICIVCYNALIPYTFSVWIMSMKREQTRYAQPT